MRLTLYRHLRDTTPHPHEVPDVRALAALLAPQVALHKEDVPLFEPVELAPGATRGGAGVIAHHALVLDLDHADPRDVERVVVPQVRRVAALVYSTWGHAEAQARGECRLRVVLPLSRPVTPAERPRVWEAAAHEFAAGPQPERQHVSDARVGLADWSGQAASRAYYLPSHPPGAEAYQWFWVQDGPHLDVDALLARERHVLLPTRAALRRLAHRLSRRTGRPARALAESVRQLAEGEPYALPGARDETMWRLACELCREYPGAPDAVLIELYRRSVAAMEVQEGSRGLAAEMTKVVDKIERARSAVGAEEAERASARDERVDALLRAAGRHQVYDEDEIEALREAAGAEDDVELSKRWIVQKDGSYYLLEHRDGRATYSGPFAAGELPAAAEARLAAAQSAGVIPWTERGGQRAPRTPVDLVSTYGAVADDVVIDLAAQGARFDGRTLVVAPCPLRQLEPAHSPLVDDWLRALGGASADRLLDWVAVVTELERPCAALYLHGAKGTGKNLLASGLARLWTTGDPPDLADVLGGEAPENTMLLKCPLVLADERIPTDRRGQPATEQLRAFISSRSRTQRKKYHTAAEIRGATRTVMAANNQALLQGLGDLTLDDVAAIAERLVYVRARDAARALLQSVPRERVEALVARDEIARHALWLREHRQVARDGRFLVAGDTDELVRVLTVSTGLRSAVLNWVALWLSEPARLESPLCKVDADGAVLVSERGLQEFWELYKTNYKPPTSAALAQALTGICEGARRRGDTSAGGRRVLYRVIDRAQLRAWCDLTGYDYQDLDQGARDMAAHGQARGPRALPGGVA